MPDSKSHGNKQRILFLRSWLEQHTDDEHVVTTEEVVRLYREHGYKATRQTVADDFDALAGADVDVIAETAVRNGTRTNAWHYGQRHFETAELKVLVDAVSSARFITAEKSETLIRKIAETCTWGVGLCEGGKGEERRRKEGQESFHRFVCFPKFRNNRVGLQRIS